VSRRSYPRVMRDRYYGKPKRCQVFMCQDKAYRTATVEWNWFRGDDSRAIRLCHGHGKQLSGKPSVINPSYTNDCEIVRMAGEQGSG